MLRWYVFVGNIYRGSDVDLNTLQLPGNVYFVKARKYKNVSMNICAHLFYIAGTIMYVCMYVCQLMNWYAYS
jgi:hypothetical protein